MGWFDAYSKIYYGFSYDLAEECADDDEDKVVIRKLRRRVLKKLKMHNSLVQVSLA